MKPLERNGLTQLLKTEKPKTIEPAIQSYQTMLYIQCFYNVKIELN